MNRRLYRSRTDTILGGVAAGLAQYLDSDPALVRIAWAILVLLTSGAALVAYVVAWIVIPEAPSTTVTVTDDTGTRVGSTADAEATPERGAPAWTAPEPARSDGTAGVVVGVGLVLLGVWFLLREYLPDFEWGLVWPLLIVAVGIAIVATSMRRREG